MSKSDYAREFTYFGLFETPFFGLAGLFATFQAFTVPGNLKADINLEAFNREIGIYLFLSSFISVNNARISYKYSFDLSFSLDYEFLVILSGSGRVAFLFNSQMDT
jgi:hypothetical protein